MALLVGTEAAISIAAIGVTVLAMRRMDPGNGAVFLAGILLYIAVVWTFAVWNRRGTWRPLTETVEGFVAVSVLRCRRGLRSVTFALTVVLAQALLTAGWVVVLAVQNGPAGFSRAMPILTATLSIGPIYLIWAIWYRRLMLRRLAWLERWDRDPGILALHQEGA